MGLYQAYNKKEEERDVPQFEKHFALYVFQVLKNIYIVCELCYL